ncbi:MAG: quinone oxidoreductase family protein [Deinococcus sp.]
MRAVQVMQSGGPEVLKLVELALPPPAQGEVRLRLRYAGLNYIDVYQRRGQGVKFPLILGKEGMGVVEGLGEGVTGLEVGQRVAFGFGFGAYAEEVNLPAHSLVRVPDAVSDELAAALLLQGMTAHYLVRSTYPLQAGDLAVVHAAAGGVGGLLVQLCKLLGATVLATAGSQEKRALALELGADEALSYDDFAPRARELGGAHVVYDGVGQSTFAAGLDALRVRGLMAIYGAASGPVPPLDVQTLNAKGGLFVTRPSLAHYTRTPGETQERCDELFGWVAQGRLKVRVDRVFDLSEVAEAHRYLEGRRTLGKVLLRTA